MQAAVSGEYFLEKGLSEFNSTVLYRFQFSQEKCILIMFRKPFRIARSSSDAVVCVYSVDTEVDVFSACVGSQTRANAIRRSVGPWCQEMDEDHRPAA